MAQSPDYSALIAEKVAFLTKYKRDILAFFNDEPEPPDDRAELRARISRTTRRARGIVSETGIVKTVTLSPPPAVGGVMLRDADPFDFVLQDYYGRSLIPTIADTIEEAIGSLESPEYLARLKRGVQPQEKPTTRHPEALVYPKRMTVRWLIDEVPVRFWVVVTAALLSAALALFGVGFRLGQDPKAVEALHWIPGLEQASAPTPTRPSAPSTPP